VEKIRRSTGLEYEYLLQERLHNMGIAFSGEEELRAQGLPKVCSLILYFPLMAISLMNETTKTPDVKLLVPFAIKLAPLPADLAGSTSTSSSNDSSPTSEEWFVVNWIESKASFGDEVGFRYINTFNLSLSLTTCFNFS